MIGSVALALIAGGFIAFLSYKKLAGHQQQDPRQQPEDPSITPDNTQVRRNFFHFLRNYG